MLSSLAKRSNRECHDYRNFYVPVNCLDENEESFTESDDDECERGNIESDSDEEYETQSEEIHFSNKDLYRDDSDCESSNSEVEETEYSYEEGYDCDEGEYECGECDTSDSDNSNNSDDDDSECDINDFGDSRNVISNSDESESDESESDDSEYDHDECIYKDILLLEDSQTDNESENENCSDDYNEYDCYDSDENEREDEYCYKEYDVNETDNSDSDDSRSCDLSHESIELACSNAISEIHDKDLLHGFFDFYNDLHDFFRLKFSVSKDAIKRAINHLMYNYANLNKCVTPDELNFTDISLCLGYLRRYGICHTALVYHAMIKVIETTPAVTSMLSGKKLNLMCLGSGPGNDFVGLIFALFSCQISITDLDVTVVDKSPGWEVIFTRTVEMLTSPECVESDKATFIEADLVKSVTWNDTMKNKLRRAHVVTLVKVLSNISKADHLETLKNIIGCMKDDALLILIDCPLPFAELSLLNHFLILVYKADREQFTFTNKETRSGIPNIKKCSAYVRVYKKRNSLVQYEEMNDSL